MYSGLLNFVLKKKGLNWE